MKASIQKILLGFLATVCLQGLHSQNTVSYGYDYAGNRVSRTIIMNSNSLKSAPAPTEEPAVYTEMLSEIRLNIYPNPTDGLLKVEILNLPENHTAHIMLYNLSGQVIVTHRKVDGFAEIDISREPVGTYLMKVIAGEYHTEWKIIKK
ncbi:MAG: T9SS type A sorting domain-containing protein [Candidatus Azobacteroides sp.]|nr:T9SS type A sorting domain-containing protein [Candidatus Azobacteroides sp.]